MKTIQSVYGIYKKYGREAFLAAAQYYSDRVNPNSVEKTISEMESRWYDESETLTEAEKMVADYKNGLTILNEQNSDITIGQQIFM